MSVLKLIRRMISPLLFLNIVSRYKGRSSLMKIKAAQLYVQGVQKARILFLGSLVGLISLIFLASGLSLIHLFREGTWAKFSEINTVLNSVVKNGEVDGKNPKLDKDRHCTCCTSGKCST